MQHMYTYRKTSNYRVALGEKTSVYRGSRRSVGGPSETALAYASGRLHQFPYVRSVQVLFYLKSILWLKVSSEQFFSFQSSVLWVTYVLIFVIMHENVVRIKASSKVNCFFPNRLADPYLQRMILFSKSWKHFIPDILILLVLSW